eukprot:11190-Heterococcus_DN1.PRE.2
MARYMQGQQIGAALAAPALAVAAQAQGGAPAAAAVAQRQLVVRQPGAPGNASGSGGTGDSKRVELLSRIYCSITSVCLRMRVLCYVAVCMINAALMTPCYRRDKVYTASHYLVLVTSSMWHQWSQQQAESC